MSASPPEAGITHFMSTCPGSRQSDK